MPNSSPEWVQTVAVTVIVNNVPVTPQVSTELAIGIVNRYSGSAVTYQELCKWTVAAGKIGQLAEVSMAADLWAKAVWQLTVGSETIMSDDVIQTALTLPFVEVSLVAGTEVTLSVKSSDGTAIVADGSISGKEVG